MSSSVEKKIPGQRERERGREEKERHGYAMITIALPLAGLWLPLETSFPSSGSIKRVDDTRGPPMIVARENIDSCNEYTLRIYRKFPYSKVFKVFIITFIAWLYFQLEFGRN